MSDMTSTDTPKPRIIAIDFDGTCVTHAYPKVGKEIGAVPVLRALVASGHRLVIFTMRSDDLSSDPPRRTFEDAVRWFERHDIPIFGLNRNPEQDSWTSSPKAYANLYIDDAAMGAPLVEPCDARPFICWRSVANKLHGDGYFKQSVFQDLDYETINFEAVKAAKP
jgi:hypothetical protein